MKRIGIIGAMEEEVSRLKEEMTDVCTATKAGMVFLEGRLCGCDAVVVQSGIGKVNAGMCTQILADDYAVGAVINTGIAGGLLKEIHIGDIVISTDALQYDVHAEVFGYAPGEIPRMGRVSFPADESLISLAEQVCAKVNPEIATFRGRVVSGDRFISDPDVKQELREVYGGACAEMEGAAIAQAAFLNEIPCVILRAISDNADDSAAEDSETFDRKAIRHSVNLVMGMLKELSEK